MNNTVVYYNLLMIIDAHTHIFSPDISGKREYYCSKDACFNSLYSSPKAKLCQVEDLIKSMDDNGIAKSIVLNIGWINHDLCVRNNDYIIESVSRYPERLIGFCSVQPTERSKALKELERCFAAGMRGVGELRPDVQGYDLDDDELMSVLIDIILKNKAFLTVHASEPVGHEYGGKGQITPEILYQFIKKHSDLNIILAHFGGGLPFYELMPEVKAELKNTYYDTAAAPFLYSQGIYSAVNRICGSNKLLFGSDWPLLDQSRCVKHVKSSRISTIESANILYNNISRLLN